MSRSKVGGNKLKDNTFYHNQIEKLQGSSLPIKDKLEILDRDILSLKLTDHDLQKRIQRMTNLVRTQTIMVVLNIIASLVVIYLVVSDIFSIP